MHFMSDVFKYQRQKHPLSLNPNFCCCASVYVNLVFPVLFFWGIECVAEFGTVQALEIFSSTHFFPLVI